VTLTAGNKEEVALDAQPAPSPPPSPVPSATVDSTSAKTDASGLRPFAYVAGAWGVAGFVTFAVAGAMNQSTYNGLETACGNQGCPPGKQEEINSGKTQQTIANVGLVVGIVGVAAGATLFVLSLRKSAQGPSTALVVGPAWVGLRGSL
jgi:hypothetical protein